MAFGDHVKVRLGLDSKGFNDGLGRAQMKAQKFGANFKSTFVGAIGTAVIARASQQIIDFGASIGDLSDRVGVSAEFLQKMQFSAEQNGASAEEANKAISRLAKSIGDAKDGLSTAVRGFEQANVTFKNTDGTIKSVEQVMYDLADGLKGIDDDGKRVKVAFDLMGRSGLALTQFMNGGSDAMKAFGDQAEDLGFILSNKNVKALQDASGELEKLGRELKVFGAKNFPPLFEKFKQLIAFLREVFTEVGKFKGELILAGKAIATYWATIKVLGGLKVIIGGFIGLATAIKGTTLAVGALNVATKANPLGILVTGAMLLVPLFDKLINRTQNYKQELEEITARKIEKSNAEIVKLNESTTQVKVAISELKKELQGVEEPKVASREQLAILEKEKIAIEGIIKEGKRRQEDMAELVQMQTDYVKELEEEKASAIKIAEQKEILAEHQAELAKRELEVLNAQQTQKQIVGELVEGTRVLKDQEDARKAGLEDLLEDRNKEVVELERATERAKALRTQGEEGLKVVEARHKLEDKIVALMKDGAMTFEQAMEHATKLAEAQDQEKQALEDIKEAKEGLNKLDGDALAKQKAKLERAVEEKRRLEANKEVAQANLDILRLQAQGMDDQAMKLEEKLRIEKDILAIMDLQEVNAGKAGDQKREEIKLRNQVAQKQLEENRQEIINNAVKLNANRDLKNAIDRKDKQRIRASKDVEAIDRRIAELQKEGGERAQNEIEKLQQIRNRKLEFVIDDETKNQLDAIDDKKVELDNRHGAQMDALNLALQNIQQKQQQADNDARIIQAEIAQAGAEQKGVVQGVIDGGKQAFEKLGQGFKQKLDAIKEPAVEVKVENELKEYTQEAILTELKTANTKSSPDKETLVNVDQNLSDVEDILRDFSEENKKLLTDLYNKASSDNSADAIQEVAKAITQLQQQSPASAPNIENNINVDAPIVSNNINVDIDSELKESTQQSILSAISSLSSEAKGDNGTPIDPTPPPPPIVSNEVNVVIESELKESTQQAILSAVSSLGQTMGSYNTPPISVQDPAPPIVANNINIVIESELKEQTQRSILGHIAGKFINQ